MLKFTNGCSKIKNFKRSLKSSTPLGVEVLINDCAKFTVNLYAPEHNIFERVVSLSSMRRQYHSVDSCSVFLSAGRELERNVGAQCR